MGLKKGDQMIETPPNMPRIAKVLKHWPYRVWYDFEKRKAAGLEGHHVEMYRRGYDDREDIPAIAECRWQMATITAPEYPGNHIDNHSGFEVELKNGTRAFVLFSDGTVTMYQL